MRRHPLIGYEMLKDLAHLQVERAIILAHHERWDGSGYPTGIVGTAIPLGARIFNVADTLDAMTSDRPYRKQANFAVAKEEIVRGAGAQFDPDVVDAFLEVKENFRSVALKYADLTEKPVRASLVCPPGQRSRRPAVKEGKFLSFVNRG